MVKLSIIIPVYNVGQHIRKTLHSILSQSEAIEQVEIIVVNDGSTDNSKEIVEDVIGSNLQAKIRLLTSENRGVSVARNRATELAEGRFLYYLDGDDYVNHDFLATVMCTLDRFDPDVLIFGYNKVDENDVVVEDGRTHVTMFPVKHESGIQVLRDIYVDKKGYRIWTGGFIVSRELLSKNNVRYMPGCASGEDTEFQIRMFVHAQKVCFVRSVLSNYFQRMGSVTLRYNIRLFDGIIAMMRSIEFLKSTSISQLNCVIGCLQSQMLISLYIGYMDRNMDFLVRDSKYSYGTALRKIRRDLHINYPEVVRTIQEIAKQTQKIRFRYRIIAKCYLPYYMLRRLKMILKKRGLDLCRLPHG